MDSAPFHIGITTSDLSTSRGELASALGVSWTEPSGGDAVLNTVDGRPQLRPISCISREGPIHLDLIESRPGTIWECEGTRIHHFAYWTDDLQGDIGRLGDEGWQLEMTMPAEDGHPTVFAYLVRDDGFRLELIDSAGRADYEERLRR